MKTKHPISPKEYEKIFSKVPKLCVEVVIVTKEGVLLTLRKLSSWHNMWHIPGGGVIYREKLPDAVKRVAKTELGIDVHNIRFIDYIEYESEEKERGFGYSVGLAFMCTPRSLRFTLDDTASDIGFFTKLPKNIVVEQKEFLNKYRELFFK